MTQHTIGGAQHHDHNPAQTPRQSVARSEIFGGVGR